MISVQALQSRQTWIQRFALFPSGQLGCLLCPPFACLYNGITITPSHSVVGRTTLGHEGTALSAVPDGDSSQLTLPRMKKRQRYQDS